MLWHNSGAHRLSMLCWLMRDAAAHVRWRLGSLGHLDVDLLGLGLRPLGHCEGELAVPH
jgi:hypothetical protein